MFNLSTGISGKTRIFFLVNQWHIMAIEAEIQYSGGFVGER